jgi:hypothetical protein
MIEERFAALEAELQRFKDREPLVQDLAESALALALFCRSTGHAMATSETVLEDATKLKNTEVTS